MNILIVDYCVDVVGGVERTLCTIANGLAKNNNVTVLSENKFVSKSFYEYDESIKKDYLFDFSHSYQQKGLSIIQKFYRRLFLRHQIRKYFRVHEEPDVILFGRVFVSLHFLPQLSKLFRCLPKIIVRDAIHLYDFKEVEKKQLKEFFPRFVDTFVVSSDESKKEYRKFFGDRKINLVKVYNPIGIKPIIGYMPSAKTVVSIGRMDNNQKGFDALIRAFVLVHQRYPDWRLHIYGDGKMKNELSKLVTQLEGHDYISFMGTTKNVVEAFNKSSIFVLASRYEGYANILVEALACGIPSISYNWLMGVEEIIKNGVNGSIVYLNNRLEYYNGINNDKDCENLTAAICNLISSPMIMEQYNKQGPTIVESRNPDTIFKKWKQLIEGRK